MMEMSQEINEIAKALHKAQSEMKGAKKSKDNPFFKSKYADLKDIIKVSKEALDNNGLSYSQHPISEENKCGVETILLHVSGQWMKSKLLLACSKQDPQAYGSAITYARRYSLQAVLGIPSEDDDGNSATHNISTKKDFLDHYNVSTCDCGEELKNGYSKCYKCFQEEKLNKEMREKVK